MKKLLLNAFLFLFVGQLLWGQAPELKQLVTVGGSDREGIKSITKDTDGNIYVAGEFRGTLDFDNGPGEEIRTPNGQNDLFIAKYTPTGELTWLKTIGNGGFEFMNGIVLDNQNNVYVAGVFQNGAIDLDPGAGEEIRPLKGDRDIFFFKLTTDGDFVWGNTFGSSEGESANLIIDDNNLYLYGFYNKTVDFDPSENVNSLTAVEGRDGFIGKYTTDGELIWVTNVGGTDRFDEVGIPTIDNDGNILLTGGSSGTMEFTNDLGTQTFTSIGSYDIYILKLAADGSFLSINSFGGLSIDFGSVIRVDAKDNIYVTGAFKGTVDFDMGPDVVNRTSPGSFFNFFLLKLNKTFDFQWVLTGTNDNRVFPNTMEFDLSDNVILAGTFSGNCTFSSPNFSKTLSSDGSNTDIFTTKVSPEGEIDWAFRTGGSNADDLTDMYLDEDNTLYLCGEFRNTVNFDFVGTTNATSVGDGDGFIAEYYQCKPTSSTIDLTQCNLYEAPDETIYTETGLYTATIANAEGCDSTISINLTIIDATYEDTVKLCAGETYEFGTQSITSTGSYIETFITDEPCDSTVILTVEKCTVTGTEIVQGSSIQVHPNPAVGSLTIEGTRLDQSIALYTIQGTMILQERSQLDTTVLDISYLDSGTYILQIDQVKMKIQKY